ncbi:indolepyruvate oxidoreductase subunit beta [Chloroflexota bacterium]
MKKLDILITGVGGQGVILASDIIGEVAITAGFDVKKTDTLGMAQRGGSVVSNLRIADTVSSPIITEGSADVLLAFEKLEAVRWVHWLAKDGVAIINDHIQPPLSVSLGRDPYPTDDEVKNLAGAVTNRMFFMDGNGAAAALGNVKALNTFLLGCISPLLPVSGDIWKKCITDSLPPKLHELNLKAFDRGCEEIYYAGLK